MNHNKVKVKCTLVQAPRLCTGHTAHRGSRGIVLLFHDHGTRQGWGVSVTPQPLFTPGKDPVPIVQEGGWAPGLVWTGAENLAPTGIQSPDRPARRHSLYRYPELYSFLTTALEGGEGSASRPGRSLPLGKTQYPLYRRVGGPQGRSGQVRKISPPPGFDPRTFQPVASRYTDWAIQHTWTIMVFWYF